MNADGAAARPIMVAPQVFAGIESKDVVIVSHPVDNPAPRLGGDQQYEWHHESWSRDEAIIDMSITGQAIAYQCPFLALGRVRIVRFDRRGARPIVAHMECVDIRRLHHDLTDDLLWYGFFDVDDVTDVFQGRHRTIQGFRSAWDMIWGATLYKYDRNPHVWRMRIRVLTRDQDGESGRTHAGNWGGRSWGWQKRVDEAEERRRPGRKKSTKKRHPWRDR